MTAFKPGDRVLVEAELAWIDDCDAGVRFSAPGWARASVVVPPGLLRPVPEPLYVDPELVPGMVVAPLDADDDREWWVAAASPYVGADCWFIERSGSCVRRAGLPDEIRVVRPREATS
jgi:hypothetical protein